MEARDKITKQIIQLQKDNPFWAFLISYMKIKESKNLPIKTMAVDYKGNLYYDKEFVESLNEEELRGILAHEVCHLMLNHLARREKRNPLIANISADLVVNDILVENEFKIFGDLVPYNHSCEVKTPLFHIKINDINKKSFEEIYDEIVSQIKQQMINNIKQALRKGENIEVVISNDDISVSIEDLNLNEEEEKKLKEIIDKAKEELKGLNKDEHRTIDKDLEGKTEQEKEEIRRKAEKFSEEFKEKVAEAGILAKQRGLLPAGLERLIGDLLEPKISWKYLLNKYITNELINDFSFRKPSKRSQAVGVYLPSTIKENISVVIGIDTSESISQEELTEFLSEVVGIARTYNNIKMRLLTHDYEIQDDYEVRNGNIKKIMNLKIHGGGGTSHKCVYDYIKQKKIDCRVLVLFTDGYSDLEEIKSDIKTIIVLCKNAKDIKREDVKDLNVEKIIKM